MSNDEAVREDYFKAMAKRAKKADQEKAENSGGQFNFEAFKWTGFAKQGSKILRLLGGFPLVDGIDPKDIDTKHAGRVIKICKIYGDDRKPFYAYVPDKKERPDYIFWRMYETVLKREWIDDPKNPGKKMGVYLYQKSFPELLSRFTENGHSFGISKNMYDSGWKPQDSLIINVIDRGRIKEHQEAKHSFLLSKNFSVQARDDGTERIFYDYGVPSFGFLGKVLDMASHYGDFSNYDICATRVGKKEEPFKIINAVKYSEEVPDSLKSLVSGEPLTEEESSWGMYDIEKIFKPTSMTKWYSHIKIVAKEIDLKFKTHFYEELEDGFNVEKAERLKAKASGASDEDHDSEAYDGADSEEPEAKEKDIPVRRREAPKPTVNLSWDDFEKAGFTGKDFFAEASPYIQSFENGAVTWKKEAGNEIGCMNDNCTFTTPQKIEGGCIKCGEKFN